jgi:hypothetical protein
VSNPVLQIWDIEDAPESLRLLVPAAYAEGWLAFIAPGGESNFLEEFLTRCHSPGLPVIRCEVEGGGILLTGPHLPPEA